MKTFDELWADIEERSRRWAIPIVQDKKELEYVFNLIKGCKSYLEIGTAEGNGLYVLGHAIDTATYKGCLHFVDYGEAHTSPARDEAVEKLKAMKKTIWSWLGNSHEAKIISRVNFDREEGGASYDIVFIDAGHTYEDVIADAIAYGHLATKYIFFHDIQLPEVRKAYEWYAAQNPQMKKHEFINSETYGYGIIEV